MCPMAQIVVNIKSEIEKNPRTDSEYRVIYSISRSEVSDEAHQYRIWQYGRFVAADRHCQPESAPVKRTVQEARDRGMVVDGTYGRRTRAVLIMDSDHVVLSALQPETVAARFAGETEEGEPEDA